MPTELELIALETEFDLYLTFTKRLVLNLPDSDDRTRAARWLQKLRSINNDEQKKLRNEHLKLLLFALHRRSMLSVFEKPPPEELESFHDGLTLLEMTRELIELTEKKMAGGDNSGECPLPPVSTNISADLKEYGASQLIPKFGAHVYYAISNEPIQMWSKSANCVYPAASDVPNPLQWELTLSKLTDHVLEKQAEADRLAVEAEKGDKTEMLMKEDDTHVLPKIDVPAKEEAPFKWKADSILILHQNYDFSDVGVAEDLDEQGKLQLELDEMALGILDHSLPGRQKVVVRDPYYKGMPPDISERRHHGVIDDISSSSSSDMESFSGVGGGSTNIAQMKRDSGNANSFAQNQNSFAQNQNSFAQNSFAGNQNSYAQNQNSFAQDFEAMPVNQYGSYASDGVQNAESMSQNFVSAMLTKDTSNKLGPLARKYLLPETNFLFGLHFDKNVNGFRVGRKTAVVDGNDILVYFDSSRPNYFDGKMMRYIGTEGLWRLITQSESYFDEIFDENYDKPSYFSDADWVVYMEMLLSTNRSETGEISTFNFLYDWLMGQIRKVREGRKDRKETKGFGLIGYLGEDLYKLLDVASKDPSKFWDVFKGDACVNLKEMDELLRILTSYHRYVPEGRQYCGATYHCLAMWFIQRMFMTINKENGMKLFFFWMKINEPLVVRSRILLYFTKSLPWGSRRKVDDRCGSRENVQPKPQSMGDENVPTPQPESPVQSRPCNAQKKLFEKYVNADEKYADEEILKGMDNLSKIFQETPDFFNDADIFTEIDGGRLHRSFDSLLRWLTEYYSR